MPCTSQSLAELQWALSHLFLDRHLWRYTRLSLLRLEHVRVIPFYALQRVDVPSGRHSEGGAARRLRLRRLRSWYPLRFTTQCKNTLLQDAAKNSQNIAILHCETQFSEHCKNCNSSVKIALLLFDVHKLKREMFSDTVVISDVCDQHGRPSGLRVLNASAAYNHVNI